MHSTWQAILTHINRPLVVALVAAGSAQLLKFFLYIWYRKRARFERLFGAGGMPSSHSAMVGALTTAIGFEAGFLSPLFAISSVLGIIVLYDAIGVRRTVGLQSKYLNRVSDTDDFPEFVGHTPIEVLMGALWGILLGIVFYRL